MVAAPDVVDGVVEELDGGNISAGGIQESLNLGVLLGGGVDADRDEAAEGGGEVRKEGGNAVEAAGPEGGIAGPGEPHGGLGRPFRREAEAEGSGSR